MATKSVVVTRGNSFIGAHLIENLLKTRHHICIVDDSESKEFLGNVIDRVETAKVDMARNPAEVVQIFKGYDTVFHLADTYGGCNARHYQPALLCENTVVDNVVVDSAATAGVSHVQFCSSNCTHTWKDGWMQTQYGLSKLNGESVLKARCDELGMKGSIVKLASTYGPGQSETHPVIELIAKAFVRQEPYEMPSGSPQHFTYVQDVVECMRMAAEKIGDCSQISIGTQELTTMSDLMEKVFECVGWRPGKVFSNPAKQIIEGGQAVTSNRDSLEFDRWKGLREGIKETADWYMSAHSRAYVQDNLQMLLQGITPEQPAKREYRRAAKLRKMSV